MTIRTQVQDEAKKAAIKIRQAVEAFTAATGLELCIDVDYMTMEMAGDPVDSLHVIGVRLVAGGVRAAAQTKE